MCGTRKIVRVEQDEGESLDLGVDEELLDRVREAVFVVGQGRITEGDEDNFDT